MLGLCLLPQGEVGLIALLTHAVEIVAAGIFDVLQTATRENTVLILLVVGLDIEIDRAIRLVGEAIIEDLLHELLLFDDMACGVGLNRRTEHAEGIHRLMVAVGVVLCNLHRLQLLQTGFLGNLVLTLIGIVLKVAYISDITHVSYFITQVLQIAEHEIEGDSGTGMSEMGITIDCRTAHIHAHIGRMKGLETLLLTRQRIVNN